MKTDLEDRYLYLNLDIDELLVIATSASYRPEAQKVAREMLLRRGISDEYINQWRDQNIKFETPTRYINLHKDKLRRMFKRHRIINQTIFYLFIGLLAVSQFILFTTAIYRFVNERYHWSVVLTNLLTYFMEFSFFLVRVLLIYSVLHGVLWRKPLQILLLRPFEYTGNRKQIRRFAKHYLRYLGHTYTLSDSIIKTRTLLLESPQLFVSQLLLLCFHSYYEVSCIEEIPRMEKFISRKKCRNIAWALSWDKIFKISCVHSVWKPTIQHLINRVHVIVLDLSHGGEGINWELKEIGFYNATDKLIFIVHQDSLSKAQYFLKSSGLSELNKELFVYGDKGLAVKHKELTAILAYVAAMSLTASEAE